MVSKDRSVFFMSGLPRSGSTALGNLLAQNPDIFFTGQSPVCEISYRIAHACDFFAREQLDMMDEYDRVRRGSLRAFADQYYSKTDRRIIVDKCRTWSGKYNRELAQYIFGHNKNIVLVRPIDEIVKSYASIRIKNGWQGDLYGDLFEPNDALMMHPLECLKYTATSARQNTLFVSYDDIILQPRNTISAIYRFLGEPIYDHNFGDITETVPHNDEFLGLTGLHEVRSKLEKRSHSIILPNEIKDKCADINNTLISLGVNLGKSLDFMTENKKDGTFC